MSDNTELEIVKKPNQLDVITPDQEIEFVKCMNDVLYFTETYVKISHPTQGRVPFVPFPYQRTMLQEFQKNRFNIALTARQMGKCIFGKSKISINDNLVEIQSTIKLNFKDKIVNLLEGLLIKLI